ncbi:MAG: enoyl-CoA hydratase/isomerase family protein [Dehalococcoidia bacterium]
MGGVEFQDIIVEERASGVALVKLNRPEKLNAFGGSMNEELAQYLESLNHGEYRIRAVVLTGEGRAFCAGGNVMSFPAADPTRAAAPWRPGHPYMQVVHTMRHCDVPLIAAINGYAVGAGWSLALACDLRIAAEDALFQVAQTKRGIVADAGLSYFLPRVLGSQRALELMFTGRRITAREALDLGVVLEVVPPELLVERAIEIAEGIAAGPPLSAAAHKRLVYGIEDDDMTRVQELTGLFVGKLFYTEDGREGVRSFVDRREPVFSRR